MPKKRVLSTAFLILAVGMVLFFTFQRGYKVYGNEIWLTVNGEKREKSISRSTVELGYKKAREMGIVKGPKALGLPGNGSYLYPIFLRLGVCIHKHIFAWICS